MFVGNVYAGNPSSFLLWENYLDIDDLNVALNVISGETFYDSAITIDNKNRNYAHLHY